MVSIVELIATLLISGWRPSTSVVFPVSTGTPVLRSRSRFETEIRGVARTTVSARAATLGLESSYRAVPTLPNIAFFAMPVLAPTTTSSGATTPSSPAPTAPSTPGAVIPAGTVVTVCLIDSVGPRSYPGQLFRATIARESDSAFDLPIPLRAEALFQLVSDGIAATAPRTPPILKLIAIQIRGRFFEVTATPPSADGPAGATGSHMGPQRRPGTKAKEIGYGVVIGAASGGAVGGLPGAGIGAAAGGGIAAVRNILVRGQRTARIASEARLTFTLTKDLVLGPIGESPQKNTR
jgi:hypothetical protein